MLVRNNLKTSCVSIFDLLGFCLNYSFTFLQFLIEFACFSFTERSHITFWHYSGFGTKLSPIFGFAKSSQIQNHLSIKPNAQIRCSGGYVMAFRHNINQLKTKKYETNFND